VRQLAEARAVASTDVFARRAAEQQRDEQLEQPHPEHSPEQVAWEVRLAAEEEADHEEEGAHEDVDGDERLQDPQEAVLGHALLLMKIPRPHDQPDREDEHHPGKVVVQE